MDVYRQDRNFYPYRFWRDADVADRQGITEIRHVQGLYEMWDELLRRHPGLIIDNANWRGTGPDLEMVMRLAGSWTSSEAAQGGANRVFNQVQMAGLSLYVPIHASLLWGTDPYSVRSVARFGTSISYDTRPASFSVPEMKQAGEEIRSLRPLYLGDYYPLTAVDLDEQHWCGWQFDRPDLGQGFAMFFRRPASPDAAYDAHLSALEPEAQYDVSFAETYQVKEKRHMTGRQLASLHIEIDQRPGSILSAMRGKKDNKSEIRMSKSATCKRVPRFKIRIAKVQNIETLAAVRAFYAVTRRPGSRNLERPKIRKGDWLNVDLRQGPAPFVLSYFRKFVIQSSF